jgi:transketolase
MTMRSRFYELASDAIDGDERIVVVVAAIGVSQMRPHERLFDVGIREQLMISVAAGLALEGYRPIVHSYTPFLVERPYEQVKLDLGHQSLGAVLVSYGGSYDASTEGRTHQAPEDVAALAALPGWTIHVPGHVEELERAFAGSLPRDDRVYIRLSEHENHAPVRGEGLVVLREGSQDAPFVIAVGPSLAPTLAATSDRDATVAYLTTVRPFPADTLLAALRGTDVVVVEPYLAGTSSAEVSRALIDRPHRLLALGVENTELRRYGTPDEHRAAHGLDAAGIHRSLAGFC